MAATIADLNDGLRELLYKEVNNTYALVQAIIAGGVIGGGGGGTVSTEYTEGNTSTAITGPAIMWEDASDTLRAVSATKPLPVVISSTITIRVDQGTPGSTNAVQAKQYTGTPSNFAIGTADATVFTLAAGEVGFIQNLDDVALAVKKGAGATASSFSLVLPPGTAVDDGKGGAVTIDDWVGVVSVAAITGSPRFISWKQAP